MNTSSRINKVIYELVSYYIDNQLPFNIIALDKEDSFDLPKEVYYDNSNAVSIDILEWNLETAEYDDKHLYVTYVYNNEEIPLTIPLVNINTIMDMTHRSIVFVNIFETNIDDVIVTDTNLKVEKYVKTHEKEIAHSMSCLSLCNSKDV